MTKWALLRIWHVETMDFQLERPWPPMFTRTSYCVVPAALRDLPREAWIARVEVLLKASYDQRNHMSRMSGDYARMELLTFDFEWVDAADAPADPEAKFDNILVNSGVRAPRQVFEAAAIAVLEPRNDARPGLAKRPWTRAFSAWRIDADETWHVLSYPNEAVFDMRLGSVADYQFAL